MNKDKIKQDIIPFVLERIRAKGILSVIGSISHYVIHSPPLFLDRIGRIGKRCNAPLFDKICIQTQTECNYDCPFCPNKKIDRPHGVMSLELYKKIIDELSSIDYNGVIYPYIQEPLLDKRIVELCRYASNKCPKARIIMESNGSLLNEKLAHELFSIPNLKLIVNDYTSGSVIKKILSFDLTPNERKKIILRKRSLSEKLTNRAGIIGESVELNNFCVIPFVQFFVTFDGKIILCCQDWKHEEIMGDVNKQTIQEIWNDNKYRILRKNLLRFNRVGICSKCDYWGIE